MKWIKASERLPSKRGKYCIKDYRYKSEGENSSALFSEVINGKHNSLFFKCPNKVEWLDETETHDVSNVEVDKKLLKICVIEIMKGFSANHNEPEPLHIPEHCYDTLADTLIERIVEEVSDVYIMAKEAEVTNPSNH